MAVRKPEQGLWDRLSRAMRGYWAADRIETRVASNVPDVFFTLPFQTGWIELKQIFRFPKRDTTPVKMPNFTPGQRRWLTSRHRSGANCWFLLYVQLTDEYLFIPGDQLEGVGTTLNRYELYQRSFNFHGMPTADTLKRVLKGERK